MGDRFGRGRLTAGPDLAAACTFESLGRLRRTVPGRPDGFREPWDGSGMVLNRIILEVPNDGRLPIVSARGPRPRPDPDRPAACPLPHPVIQSAPPHGADADEVPRPRLTSLVAVAGVPIGSTGVFIRWNERGQRAEQPETVASALLTEMEFLRRRGLATAVDEGNGVMMDESREARSWRRPRARPWRSISSIPAEPG